MGKFLLLLSAAAILLISVIPGAADDQADKLMLTFDGVLMQSFQEGMRLYWDEDYAAAERIFRRLAEDYPDFATARIYLADCLIAQGRYQEALQHYETACALLQESARQKATLVPDAHEPDLYADIVYCLNALGRYQEAKKQGLMGTIHGQSPDLYVNLAYTYHKLDNPSTAKANFCSARTAAIPNELRSFTMQRLEKLFENGRRWSPDCREEQDRSSGTHYALIIAVGKYSDPRVKPLSYAENDARELYRLLTNPRTGLFDPQHVTVLINEQATEKNIKFAFDDISLKASRKEDVLLVFFAGHGFAYPDGHDTYWLTYDTMVGDETGNRIKSTAISNLTLAAKLGDVQADTMVFLIDTCFSSGMVNRHGNVRGLESYLSSGKDYVIITSSGERQRSIESTRLEHGLFTYFLIEGLSGKADNDLDGFVDVEELWPYVRTNVSSHAKLLGAEQDPRRAGSSGTPVYLSKNPNY